MARNVQSSQKGISRPKWSDLFSDRNYPHKTWHLSTQQSSVSVRLLLLHGRSTHPERSLYPGKRDCRGLVSRSGVGLFHSLRAPMAARQERLGHVDCRSTMGQTHLAIADDVRAADEPAALLRKEFLALDFPSTRDLPKLTPNAEAVSELIAEAF